MSVFTRRRAAVAGAAVAAVVLAACGGDPTEGDADTITVGSAGFNDDAATAERLARVAHRLEALDRRLGDRRVVRTEGGAHLGGWWRNRGRLLGAWWQLG